ncbi:MAG: MmcQ/YjbR family DNA-binding protein [Candidatus Korobacteraceae bacterium]|jgi:predicted DNA-binding protein (MmcQ/YjbR family)
MDIEAIRRYCLQFPHTTENLQWGCDLCFKVDGKLFLVMPLEPAPVRLSLKCSAEKFAELCQRPGVRPAPYLARAQWVSLEQLNTLLDAELRELIAEAYQLVWERLPKKRQQELKGGGKPAAQEENLTSKIRKNNPTSKTKKANLIGKTRKKAGRRG